MHNEKIQEYIEGRLPAEDKTAFEKRLDAERALRSDYMAEMARHTALQATMRVQAKEELKKMLSANPQPYTRVRSLRPMWMAAAIAAGILLLLSLGYLFTASQETPEQLAMNYLEPYVLDNPRGEGNESPVVSFQQSLHEASQLLSERKAKEAIRILKPLEGQQQGADAIEWYLALAYLQDGQVEASKEILKDISTKAHYRKAQAMELLDRL